jgi:methylated-DNA-[protein]-cysteine S-methyltransferase
MTVVRLTGLPAEVGCVDAEILDGCLVGLRFGDTAPSSVVVVAADDLPADDLRADDLTLARALAGQLSDWFAGRRDRVDVPLAPPHTSAFRQRVYEELARVPAGTTVTYGELAVRAGAPGAARAVGTAMATNPLPFLVPCHRVVPSTGGTGAYGGGPSVKAWLLGLEAVRSRSAGSGVDQLP